jgi:hypothetical protein
MTISEIIEGIEAEQRLLQHAALTEKPILISDLQDRMHEIANTERADVNQICRLVKALAVHIEDLEKELRGHLLIK